MRKLNIKAFTFVEIMITVTILGLALVPMISLFSSAGSQTKTIEKRLYALACAREAMETVLGTDYRILRKNAFEKNDPLIGMTSKMDKIYKKNNIKRECKLSLLNDTSIVSYSDLYKVCLIQIDIKITYGKGKKVVLTSYKSDK